MTFTINEVARLADFASSEDMRTLINLLKNPKNLANLIGEVGDIKALLSEKHVALQTIKDAKKANDDLDKRQQAITKLETVTAENNRISSSANDEIVQIKADLVKDQGILTGKIAEADAAKRKADIEAKKATDKQLILDGKIADNNALKGELSQSIASYNDAVAKLVSVKVG